jgi:hypothetical protein
MVKIEKVKIKNSVILHGKNFEKYTMQMKKNVKIIIYLILKT